VDHWYSPESGKEFQRIQQLAISARSNGQNHAEHDETMATMLETYEFLVTIVPS